jgi:hypothetical protein
MILNRYLPYRIGWPGRNFAAFCNNCPDKFNYAIKYFVTFMFTIVNYLP